MPLLSVIVPVYNEAKTVRQILDKINAINIDKEIIVVDDGSSDGTERILMEIKMDNLKIIHHATNRGKGAALLTGFANACGDYVIIQDADLEYDPADYARLIQAIKDSNADIAAGIRFSEGYHGLFIHQLGNRVLSWFLNFLFGTKFKDYATCYKLMRRDVLLVLNLKATGFDIDVEIVCNAVKKKLRIIEVPVAYHPRSYKEGKKIRLKDALWAVFYMIKYRLTG